MMEYKNGVTVKDALKTYMGEKSINISDQAKEFGISRSALSQYLNKDYYNGESFEPTICEFLNKINFPAGEESITEENNFKTSFSIHRTKNLLSIVGGCEVTYRNNGFGVISGPSGCGKTTAIQEYIKNKKDAVYVRADEMMNVKTLLRQIKKALDIDDGNVYNSYEAMLEIVEELSVNRKMVIIDEADKLLGSYTVKKVEVLRSIWDMAKDAGHPFPLMLVGMEELEYQLKGGRSSKKLAQVSSRVRPRINIKPVKDIEFYEILNVYKIEMEAKDYIVDVCREEDIGGLRTLRNILENSLQIAAGSKITLKIVKEAAKMLLN
jgi:DNA transposition AAA+ family ATPase